MGWGIALVAFVAVAVGAGSAGAGQRATTDPGVVLRGAFQSDPVTPAIFSGDLSKLPKAPVSPRVPATPADDDDGELPQIGGPTAKAVRRSAIGPVTDPFTNPSPNFDGIGYTGFVPPDTNGDVGPRNYVQTVNSQFEIFDKQGNSLAGPTNINQLWVGAGQNNACSVNNQGDPVVLYDNLADRWLISQFAVPNGFQTPPTFECIAISRTSNPVTGGWFLYIFQFNFAHDYPKLGVWPDAYYMSSQRGFSGGSLNAVAFDRTQMLAGNPATFQAFNPPGPALILLPSDLDGPAPPPGTPNFFARAVDGQLWPTAPNLPGVDRVDLYAFHVDWGTPASSTFTALPSVPTLPNDQNLCAGQSLFDNCVPQPGTTTPLETLPHWSMGHLQYRNFGTRETLVFNHTVDADNTDHAGVQWFELNRPPAGAWVMADQGTHDPDATHRWMGSIAMDKQGNLALGYSVSSGTVFPGIRYTGRLGAAPTGTMTQPETTLIAGAGSQVANGSRWGDYSSMTVDPVDDCRFWYTTEYIDSGGFWQTRIGAFRFATCDVPITASGTTINATEGASFSGTVATFTDPDTSATANEYTATINWGDGTLPTTGTITGPTGGPFTVSGTHTYTEEGTYTVTVTIVDDDTPTNTATATTTAHVADAPLTAGTTTVTGGVEGVTPTDVTFSFTDANSFATLADFIATIDWGDGTTTAGTVTGGPGNGPYTVRGSHLYREEGDYTVTVHVTDDGGSTTSGTGTAHVADAPLVAGTTTVSGGVEGVSPTTASFTFTDTNPFATSADFTATIDWGDGTTTTGTVTGGPGVGPYTVSGSHTYHEEGAFTVTITVTDDGGSTTSGAGTAHVADAPLTESCATPTVSPQHFSGSVSTFLDANPFATTADFTATISWGDASSSSGTITGGPGSGPYTVSGSHTFTGSGFFTITITVTDDGGSTATTACTVLVFGTSAGGNFVIGDRSSAVGKQVTFWGAQWAKENSLTGGPAPSAFKGFEDTPSTLAPCGTNWSTGPGNSASPPPGPLPAFMAVLVSSSIEKSGSTISGNTVHEVVVKVDPGYAPNPGHAGTGKVIAVIC